MLFTVETKKRQEIVEITGHVKVAVEKGKVSEGICNIYSPHSTTAIIITENWDAKVRNDVISVLERLIPSDEGYEHDKVDGNGHAHIKSAIIGPSKTVPISKGKLLLGKWQGIALGEFDGPRKREVIVTIMPVQKKEVKR